MSSGSITISYTTLAEIAVAAAVIGGVAFIGSKQISSSSSPSSPVPASTSSSSKSSSSKNKKKRSNVATLNGTTPGQVLEKVEHVASSTLEQAQQTAQAGVKAVKENETVQKGVEQVQKVAKEVSEKVQEQVENVKPLVQEATSTVGGGGGKSKKNKKKGGNKTPPSQPAPSTEKEKEKKKDDMRDYELEPEQPPARVMKIVGGDIGADPSIVPRGGAEDGWEKAESFDQDEGEWESVVSKKPSRPSTPSLSSNLSSQPSKSIPGLAAPSAALTKKQRENALKKAKEDACKREKEEEQERRLKAHRDALNRARAQEAALAKRPKPASQNYFGSEPTSAPKAVNGNLHQGLDPTSDGSLVWD
ncbi:uncharacterized protein JCM6883_003326 [Sporobolomyces salmoneus]|uniref:uncharacterized protein n=1 Tax=Sporobolomyces salmoneus TaxID=183962 RepID=UPI0031792946